MHVPLSVKGMCFQTMAVFRIPALKLTFSHLKMDGWNISFLLGWPILRCHVSFKECIYYIY